MSKNRVICLIWCTLMLVLCIWMSGCGKGDDTTQEGESKPKYHITIYKPNSDDVLVEGDGKIYRQGYNSDVIDVLIGNKHYMTQCSNIVIEWDVE